MTTLDEPAETAEITRPAAALCQALLLTPGHRQTDCQMDSRHKYNPVIFTQLRERECTLELKGLGVEAGRIYQGWEGVGRHTETRLLQRRS